jgi:putative hydrolase
MSPSGPLGDGQPDGADGPLGPLGPFQDMLGQFIGALGGSAAGRWDQAKQLGTAVAREGRGDDHVDPADRIAVEELVRIARLQLDDLVGLRPEVDLVLGSRAMWVDSTVDADRVYFEQLSGSFERLLAGQLGTIEAADLEELRRSGQIPPGIDPGFIIDAMGQLVGPLMLSVMVGSTVGQLAQRSFGSYDLPLPRPGAARLVLIGAQIDEFAADWDLPVDQLRMWMVVHELVSHAVLSSPHPAARLGEWLADHARNFTADPDAVESRLHDLGGLDALGDWSDAGGSDDPEGFAQLQRLLGDPSLVLSALTTPRQEELRAQLSPAVAALCGAAELLVGRISERLLGDSTRLAEAIRRHRVTVDNASRFIERLFGLELSLALLDDGRRFADEVVQRGGLDALTRIWGHPEGLPTANELATPGLWLARLDLHGESLPEVDIDVPDYLPFDDEA